MTGTIPQTTDLSDDQYWNQLAIAVDLAAKQDQIIWTVFGVFWAAHAVLLVALFANGNAPSKAVGIVVSVGGAFTAAIWCLVQWRVMGTLDHLAYQLVCKDTNDAPPNPNWIYFPIADDQAKYDAKKHGKMAGAATRTIAAIDALKPYHGGDELLWSLYRLNNIEKHRLLLTVGSQAGGIHLGQLLSMHISAEFPPEATAMVQSMTQFLMPADKGFPLVAGFELYIGGPDEEFNTNLQFRFEVVLTEAGVVEGAPATKIIHDLTARVEAVVHTLVPLLR